MSRVTVGVGLYGKCDGPFKLTPTIGAAAIGSALALLLLFVLSYFAARPSASRREKLLELLRQAGAIR